MWFEGEAKEGDEVMVGGVRSTVWVIEGCGRAYRGGNGNGRASNKQWQRMERTRVGVRVRHQVNVVRLQPPDDQPDEFWVGREPRKKRGRVVFGFPPFGARYVSGAPAELAHLCVNEVVVGGGRECW